MLSQPIRWPHLHMPVMSQRQSSSKASVTAVGAQTERFQLVKRKQLLILCTVVYHSVMKWYKQNRFNSLNVIQMQPAQKEAGFLMENRQPAAQSHITALQRRVCGAIRRLFRKNKKVDPLNTNQEEPTHERAGPSAEGRQLAAQPQVTNLQRGVQRAIRQIFKKNKKVDPLNTNQEEPTHERAGPSAEDRKLAAQPQVTNLQRGVQRAIRQIFKKNNKVVLLNSNQEEPTQKRAEVPQPTPQPQATASKRCMFRAIRQRVRAAARRIWPIRQPKTGRDTTGENDEPLIFREPTKRVPYTSKNEETATTMDDKEIQVTPSTTDMKKTTQTTTMEDKAIQVSPSAMQDKEIQVTLSITDMTKTTQTITMEDKEIQVTSSAMEDKEIQVTASTKSLTSSMESKNFSRSVRSEPSCLVASHLTDTRFGLTASESDSLLSSVECSNGLIDHPLLTSIHNEMSNILICRSFSGDFEKESLTLSTPSTTNHGTSSPVPCSGAIKVKSCELSMENFTFHGILGQGAFGKVMLASHPATCQKLAVKFIKKEKVLNSCLDCVSIELDVLKGIRGSPFITHLYGAFQTKTHLAFVLEYLNGGNLWELIKVAPIDVETLRYLTAEIVCALQYMHSFEVIHRDIKPENILLDSAGHIRIADFGLAAKYVSYSSRIKGRVGTPSYMAPEVFLYQEYFTVADYYSLGVTVYEMATGKHPFLTDQTTIHELEMAMITEQPNYPEDMDTDLRDLIDRLLCVSQELRNILLHDLRGHAFFKSIDWDDLETEMTQTLNSAPFLFEEPDGKIEVDEFLSIEDLDKPINQEEQELFWDFTYVSESLRLRPVFSSPTSSLENQENVY